MSAGATQTRGGATRRAFLSLVGGGSAIVGLAAGGFLLSRRAVIARPIHDHFPMLDLDPEGVRQYIIDFETHRKWIRRNPLKLFEDPHESVFLRYLASSDLFYRGRDPDAPIHYLALYKTLLGPCMSPCTHGLLSEEELADGEGRGDFARRHPEA